MALVTLSGVISAADLNTNFSDKTAAMLTNATTAGKVIQYGAECYALTSATVLRFRVFDFTPPCQMEVLALGLTVINTAGLTKTVTATLTAISTTVTVSGTGTEPEASKYLLDLPVLASIDAAVSATPSNSTRGSNPFNQLRMYLIPGVTHRITLATTSAVAADRAHAYVLCRPSRERA